VPEHGTLRPEGKEPNKGNANVKGHAAVEPKPVEKESSLLWNPAEAEQPAPSY